MEMAGGPQEASQDQPYPARDVGHKAHLRFPPGAWQLRLGETTWLPYLLTIHKHQEFPQLNVCLVKRGAAVKPQMMCICDYVCGSAPSEPIMCSFYKLCCFLGTLPTFL